MNARGSLKTPTSFSGCLNIPIRQPETRPTKNDQMPIKHPVVFLFFNFVKAFGFQAADLQRSVKALLHFIPVHHVPEFFDVIGAAVLEFQVIRVFPHIQHHKRRAFAASNGFAH